MVEDPAAAAALAVVVVNYHSHELLRAHLGTSGIHEAPATVIVVDNSEEVEHQAATAKLCAHQDWVHVPAFGNRGFGAGVNLGVARAVELGATRFIILNPDAWLDVATARRLGACVAEDPLRAVSPVVLRPDGRPWFSGGRLLMRRGRVRSRAPGGSGGIPWLTGAALTVSRELWERVGGFDERYFLYWEDVDLSWRIREAGGRVDVIEDLTAHHVVGATQPGSGKSPAFVFYNCRNRLMFAGLHLDRADRWGWLLGTPKLTWELIGLGGRSPAAFRAGLRGVTAGLPHALGLRHAEPWSGPTPPRRAVRD